MLVKKGQRVHCSRPWLNEQYDATVIRGDMDDGTGRYNSIVCISDDKGNVQYVESIDLTII